MNGSVPNTPCICFFGGQYFLLCAGTDGVYEYATTDLQHFSAPRPLIDARDRAGITGWSFPRLNGDLLSVTVDTENGCRGIRLFTALEYAPGCSTFRAYGDILTPSGWDCTDGYLFAGYLIFTRRSQKSSSIYAMPLTDDCRRPAGRPKRIMPDGEDAVLWFTVSDSPGMAMLYFCRGKACIASAASWTPDCAWTKRPLPVSVSGCHAALFEDLDNNFMAAVSTSDGQLQLCYLEWMGDNFALIPQ